MYKKWAIVALAAGLIVAATTLAGGGGAHKFGVLPPGSLAYGKTYGEWGAAWWQWALTFPYGQDPVTDQTGEYNMENQSGPVWFLAGTNTDVPATRTVTIPAGKAVFIPLINVLNDYPCPDPNFQPPPGQTMEEFLTEGANFMIAHVTELEFELDGVPVNNLFNYRGTSPLFTFTADPSWIAADPCVTGEPQVGVSDGYWIMLAPLPPGQHTIHARGKWVFPEWGGYSFEPQVTYNITIPQGIPG